MRSDIVPGARFPDYELPDEEGAVSRLSALQGNDPMILVLSRGNFCPKDHVQHIELAGLRPAIEVAYTKIVTITTDDADEIGEMKRATGAYWPFLSDPRREVQRDLDIQEYTDPRHDPMIPHTLVLGPGLVVFSLYNGYWFWGRPSVEDLRRDLRDVTADSRPDWDLGAPGLREAWEQGDRSRHYPYVRSR